MADNTNISGLSDKEIMDDVLSSQKSLTGIYNTYSNECVNEALRCDMLNILRSEHNMQQSVFNEMQKRGWYAPPAAQKQMIDSAKQKYTGIAGSL